MDLISVIVPVYKVEPYLDRCVQSIVDQTYRNLEIILVDDGSPDRCGEMCDAWAEKDSRIRVIHQDNKGGGAARNAALDAAKGDMIGFVDSDDYIGPDMYRMLHEMLSHGADVAECGYQAVEDDKMSFAKEPQPVQGYSVQEAMREHILDRLFRQLIWNKLYRRKLVENVRFPENTKIDDEFWTYRVLCKAGSLVCCSGKHYAYRQQENSIMHTISVEKRTEALCAKCQRHELITEQMPELMDVSLNSLWGACLYQGQCALRQLKGKERSEILRYLKKVQKEHPLPKKRPEAISKKYWMWYRLAKRSLHVACYVRNVLKIGL